MHTAQRIRLVMRLAGLLLCLLALPRALWFLFSFARIVSNRFTLSYINAWDVMSVTYSITGLYLLFGGDWLVRTVLRGVVTDKGRCECGYSLHGLNGPNCPECGRPINKA